jgi:hypothetical protein
VRWDVFCFLIKRKLLLFGGVDVGINLRRYLFLSVGVGATTTLKTLNFQLRSAVQQILNCAVGEDIILPKNVELVSR